MQMHSFYFDHIQAVKEAEQKTREGKILRLQQVRQQEALRAKEELAILQEKAILKEKETEKEEKFNEYVRKLQTIQQLQELKEKSLKEIGMMIFFSNFLCKFSKMKRKFA